MCIRCNILCILTAITTIIGNILKNPFIYIYLRLKTITYLILDENLNLDEKLLLQKLISISHETIHKSILKLDMDES